MSPNASRPFFNFSSCGLKDAPVPCAFFESGVMKRPTRPSGIEGLLRQHFACRSEGLTRLWEALQLDHYSSPLQISCLDNAPSGGKARITFVYCKVHLAL